MKITAVDTCLYPNPGRTFVWVLVRTDSGLTGLGEATLMGREEAVAATVKHMSALLVGQDPLRREFLWNRLFLSDRRRGGAVTGSAIGGIDVALWDIQGQALGVPIHALLGGRVRDEVRCYTHANPSEPAEVEDRFGPLVEAGWTAVKFMATPSEKDGGEFEVFEPSRSIAVGARIVERARAFVGEEFDLLLETHGRLRPAEVIELAQRVVPFRPMFIEEPTRPEAVESLRLIRARSPVALATGERLYHRWDFQQVIEGELIDHVQPDVVHSHGLSEVKRIADYADAHLIQVAPHNPQSPVNTMASLHLDFVIPNFSIQEVAWPFPSNLMDLFEGGPVIERGYAQPPTGAGLGIRLKEGKARAVPYRSWPLQEVRRKDGGIAEW